MGCDIHMHVEVKVDGEWLHYSHPQIPKLYGLFARLAGVRNRPEWNITPIAEPRGIPADATSTTLLDLAWWNEQSHLHSHSWVSGEELSCVVADFDKMAQEQRGTWWSLEHEHLGYLFCNDWASVPELPGGRVFGGVRAIFWFDN